MPTLEVGRATPLSLTLDGQIAIMSEEYREKDRAIWQRIFATMPPTWFEAPPSDAMEQCRTYFQMNPCARLLDLGCGFGRWALFLAGQGPAEIV